MKRHSFNMIEVVLALAVVGIGVAGIMGILPVAIGASKSAVSESNAADLARTMFSHMEALVRDTNLWVNGSKGSGDKFPIAVKGMPSESLMEKFEDSPTDNWNDLNGAKSFYYRSSANIYSSPTGVYETKFLDGNGSSYGEAQIRVWWENITDFNLEAPGVEKTFELPHSFAIRVYLEVTWPITVEYAKREKRLYVREFFNNYYEKTF